MKLYRWNGEHWWLDHRPAWRRVLRWVAWFGGWEAHSPKNAYPGRTSRWSLWWRLQPKHLAPISLLGHRITFYGWGWQIRTRNGYWVKAKHGRKTSEVYWSPNGTPSKATIWWKNPPIDVVRLTEATEVDKRRVVNG